MILTGVNNLEISDFTDSKIIPKPLSIFNQQTSSQTIGTNKSGFKIQCCCCTLYNFDSVHSPATISFLRGGVMKIITIIIAIHIVINIIIIIIIIIEFVQLYVWV